MLKQLATQCKGLLFQSVTLKFDEGFQEVERGIRAGILKVLDHGSTELGISGDRDTDCRMMCTIGHHTWLRVYNIIQSYNV